MRKVRVGIDVGGTHTKAVAIDNDTSEIIGIGSVKTTHDDKRGVSKGVIDAFNACLDNNGISADEVVFIAHSTTQATNALLEGDVAKVGIIGMGESGINGFFAKRNTKLKNISLDNGKEIIVLSKYIKNKEVNAQSIDKAIDEFINDNVGVIVASKAFGVDEDREEKFVVEEANKKKIFASSASAITKLYGLSTRTKTAALNASILPTMLKTANSTEDSVIESGIKSPLMVMRGDGGVMEISEMRKRPILTMLSGPAASVSGALMYLRASNAIFVEVGGTSTDISAIKDGQPAISYSSIGGHRTYVNSLDVRVTGIAGGSMIRANTNGIVDVGPRSAHIAGLEYAAFVEDSSLFDGAKLVTLKPTESDPDDYIAIKLNNGECVAVTPTCAANAIDILKETDFSVGNRESSRRAIEIIAEHIGSNIEDTAQKILDVSSNKIIPVIEQLIKDYGLEKDQTTLIGAGGGAGSLVRNTAKIMDMNIDIPKNAEVISSIGVALAMVREMVERTLPNPTVQQISELKKEAKNAAIRSGAVEDTIEVSIKIDEQSQKVSAIAIGATESKNSDSAEIIDEEEAYRLAKKTFKDREIELKLQYTNRQVYVFDANINGNDNVRIVDSQGFVKIQKSHGGGEKTTYESLGQAVNEIWEKYTNFASEIRIAPDIFIIDGPRILNYSGMSSPDQVVGLLESELIGSSPTHELYVVGTKNGVF
ncbi:MAG: hydantoinase/oxoprolinase family protein [Eubacteriales bacterium]|nr:hydantoinase/oxoprolinase family protein [Eubacteriales bacterium]